MSSFHTFNPDTLLIVAKLANEVIAPLVKKMDDDHKFDPKVVEALFENGVSPILHSCWNRMYP